MPRTKKKLFYWRRGASVGAGGNICPRGQGVKAAEQVAKPPVESRIVASRSRQPPTAPIMVAPSVTVPGSTDNVGSSGISGND